MNLPQFDQYKEAYVQLEDYLKQKQASAAMQACAKNIFFSWLYAISPSDFLQFIISEGKIGDVYTPGIAPVIENYTVVKNFMPAILDPYKITYDEMLLLAASTSDAGRVSSKHVIAEGVREYARKVYDFFKSEGDGPFRDELFSKCVVVITDGGRILGIGDQGAKGRYISAGKLRCYFIGSSGAIPPKFCLPIGIDIGTRSENYTGNKPYDGLTRGRVRDRDYLEYIKLVLDSLMTLGIKLVQFEDFPGDDAWEVLAWARKRLNMATFNDDIEGTAAMISQMLLVSEKKGVDLGHSLYFFVGAGGAASGISEQCIWWIAKGHPELTEEQIAEKFFFFDSAGLLYDERVKKMLTSQDGEEFKKFQQESGMVLKGDRLTALKTYCNKNNLDIKNLTVDQILGCFSGMIGDKGSIYLIGTSTKPASITQQAIKKAGDILKEKKSTSPVVLIGASNPTHKTDFLTEEESLGITVSTTNEEKEEILSNAIRRIVEVCPNILIGAGSPFPDQIQISPQRSIVVAQANNIFIFPGLGLGVWLVGANSISQYMWMAATQALFAWFFHNEHEKNRWDNGALFPRSGQIEEITERITKEVIRVAVISPHVTVNPSWEELEDGSLDTVVSEGLKDLRSFSIYHQELVENLLSVDVQKRMPQRFVDEYLNVI